MRLITMEMVTAVETKREYKKSNTEVAIEGNNASVYLFGNKIVEASDDEITYNSCSWHTNTTKERLNGLMPEHYTIIQRQHAWYLAKDGNPISKWEDNITKTRILAMV